MHLFPIYDIILFNILHYIFQYIAIYYRFIRVQSEAIATAEFVLVILISDHRSMPKGRCYAGYSLVGGLFSVQQ